jgi:DNA-binding MarR family transcriptional regulator
VTRTEAKPSVDTREEALAQLGAAFKGIMGALRRLRGRDTHRGGELSFAQYHLLFGLSEHGELSTSRLAAAADVTPATVTQMLDGLVAMGLVERSRSSSDRRVVTVALTERGRALLAEKRATWEQRWRQTLDGFSGDELATAAAVLERLRAMYDALDAEAG